MAQHSPDGGTSHFWYDRLGRLVLSRNQRQVADDHYSYTRYDVLGRITEVGELLNENGPTNITDIITRDVVEMEDLITKNPRRQITNTWYDIPYAGFTGLSEPLVAKNLRNRVSYSSYSENGNPALYDHASFFSYDIHGNVDTLLQDYRTGAMALQSQRFKKLVYRYDLISGKVNHVAYQPRQKDQFYHRYIYDADNRLTQVMTSADSLVWERDASYSYLLHGPLGRTVLGQQKVQGQDYVYTLQGWLKAINASPTSWEVGNDGYTGFPNVGVARDAYSLTLHYNRYDHNNVLSTCNCGVEAPLVLGTEFRDLYNGNIAGMSVSIPKINYPVSNPASYNGMMYYNYRYDQLNRITGMNAYTNFFVPSRVWTSNMIALNDYREKIKYDANGNILSYLRNGTVLNSSPLAMDSLSYKYYAGTNRLRQVRDSVTAANYAEDIDNQTDADNYVYDEIGNLTEDKAEGIDSNHWNVYGKIAAIYKSDLSSIFYTYDAAGNRISKTHVTISPFGGGGGMDTTVTWYARDATGNVMSVYTIKNDTAKQEEIHLYGSSRLGMVKPWRILNLDVQPGDTSGIISLLGSWKGRVFRRGLKFFELTNHLGNVLVTISDKKLGIDANTDGTVEYYLANVTSANDYYPFGMGMPGRSYSAGSGYRYGFNGQEDDSETKTQDYGMRIYDPRLARFLSVDPMAEVEPGWSPYRAFYDNPIKYIDPDGQLEYESAEAFAKANKGKTWDKDRGKGDWLKSDRENNTDIWSNANKFNLQQKDGYKQYNSIEQRAGFYGWYAVQEDLRGGETKWAGAAYIVAKQMTLMDVFYKSGDLTLMYGAKDAKDLNGFANAGNKAIFDDVFGRLRDNMNSSPLKGDAAKKWDEATLHREQFTIVQPIYEAWTKYNPKLNNYLQDFASGKGLARFMKMPPQLKFEGNIMNPQDRYSHGMYKIVPFYDMLRKAQRPR